METFIDAMAIITGILLVLGPRRKPATFHAIVLSATASHDLVDKFLASRNIPDPPLAHSIVSAIIALAWVASAFYYYRATKINGRQLTDTDFF